MAGHSFEKYEYNTFGAASDNYANAAYPSSSFNLITSGSDIYAGSIGYNAYALESFFSRAAFNWDNRYILNLSFRADGSSRFPKKNRYGFFPAGSFAWILTNEKFIPKNIKGKEKPLGVWDDETSEYDGGVYTRFKSLGAKRYAVEYFKDGEVHHSLTIAGVNKRKAIPYIEDHEKDFFDFMHFDYLFTTDCCGKNLHTYIDDEKTGTLMDYLGNVSEFQELSGVHIMATTYKMTASDDYLSLLDCVTSTYMIV